MKIISILFITIFIISFACMKTNEPSKSIDFENVFRGNFVKFDIVKESKTEVIKDNESWGKLKNLIDSTKIVRYVDFTKKIIVAVYINDEKYNNGYSVKVKEVNSKDGIFRVYYNLIERGESCINYPIHIIKLDKVDLPINFYGTTIQESCN